MVGSYFALATRPVGLSCLAALAGAPTMFTALRETRGIDGRGVNILGKCWEMEPQLSRAALYCVNGM